MVDNHFSPPKDRDAIEADDAMMGCFDGFPVDFQESFRRLAGVLGIENLERELLLLVLLAFDGIPCQREDFAL